MHSLLTAKINYSSSAKTNYELVNENSLLSGSVRTSEIRLKAVKFVLIYDDVCMFSNVRKCASLADNFNI